MVSGGDDSMTMLYLARFLGIPVTHIMHVNTQTGVPAAAEFVRQLPENEKYTKKAARIGPPWGWGCAVSLPLFPAPTHLPAR